VQYIRRIVAPKKTEKSEKIRKRAPIDQRRDPYTVKSCLVVIA